MVPFGDIFARMTDSTDLILVTGPMVTTSAWGSTADHLRKSGWCVHVPEVIKDKSKPPAWNAWPSLVEQSMPACDRPILVGFSAATTVIAALANRIPVRALLLLDGAIPPDRGPTPFAHPALRALIDGLAAADGSVPPWSHWFKDSRRAGPAGLDELARRPGALEAFERDLPRFSISWFDDTIDLTPWRQVPAAFIRLSAFFDEAVVEAERRGWPTLRVDGTHLHPGLHSDETAQAIDSICRQLV